MEGKYITRRFSTFLQLEVNTTYDGDSLLSNSNKYDYTECICEWISGIKHKIILVVVGFSVIEKEI